MQGNVLDLLLGKPWLLLIAVLCLGFSIFIHELGHYLAARRRGVVATRFSIGFGPRLCGWTDKRGTDFRLSLLPFGGYVALPQLADMGALEGGDGTGGKPLPPIGYWDKIVVSVAGPLFNILLAIVLSLLLWSIGQEVSRASQSTEIGYVIPMIEAPDGTRTASPAASAGLQVGDFIRSIDGKEMRVWRDILRAVNPTPTPANAQGALVVVFDRSGQSITTTLHPQPATDGKSRRIGIAQAGSIYVKAISANKPAAQSGLVLGDQILKIDEIPIYSPFAFDDLLSANAKRTLPITVLRSGMETQLLVPVGVFSKDTKNAGIEWRTDTTRVHENPFPLVIENASESLKGTWNYLFARSASERPEVGGPLEIVRQFVFAANDGIYSLFFITILINIILAVLNLMPIPVLDGGHILFATIGAVRGRPLPFNLVASLQMTFVLLLFSFMIYISIKDVGRIARDARPAAEDKQPEKQPTPSAPESVPAKP